MNEDNIFDEVIKTQTSQEESALDDAGADNDPNFCSGFEFMMMVNMSSQDKLIEEDEIAIKASIKKLNFAFNILCKRAKVIMYNSIANKPYYDEYNREIMVKHAEWFSSKDLYYGDVNEEIANVIRPSWFDFRRTIFVKFSLQKNGSMKWNISFICRLFHLLCENAHNYPYFFKNEDNNWKLMFGDRIGSAVSIVSYFWSEPRKYNTDLDDKVIFYVKDFFYPGSDITRTRQLTFVFRIFAKNRWIRVRCIENKDL